MSIGLINEIGAAVGLSYQRVLRVATSARKRYKVFEIPKRGGGARVVAQPAREVKAIQRAIVEKFQLQLPIHDAATGYRRGLSIRHNASRHDNCKYLLKLDFEHFFASIGEDAIRKHLIRHLGGSISEAESRFVIDACLWSPAREVQLGLCIGAPSSPLLSNTVMYEFDSLLSEYCAPLCVTYTRYSDDIALSARVPGVLARVEEFVERTINALDYPRLHLNRRKRLSVSRGAAVRVTGLTLANGGGVTVGRVRKRGVRAGIERWVRNELDEAASAALKGEVAFVLSIEPAFRDVIERKYGSLIMSILPR